MLGVAITFCFADDGNQSNGVYGHYIYYRSYDSLAYYGPENKYLVPTVYFGDIANGATVSRVLHFYAYNCIPGSDPLTTVINTSYSSRRDCFVNRDRSVGISQYADEFYYDLGTNYPDRPASGSDVSVFAEAIARPTSPPAGWINPFWNWISIPNQPIDDGVEDVLGSGLENKLFRWNAVTKTLELYPDDFTTMEVGRGYVLVAEGPLSPGYLGVPNSGVFRLSLGTPGWIWIGHPFEGDQLLANLSVGNMSTGGVRTAPQDHTAPDPWVNWNWIYWDSAGDTYGILALGGGDDDSLHAWYGYRLWANVPGLQLRIPQPE